jgi:hypothetical protein
MRLAKASFDSNDTVCFKINNTAAPMKISSAIDFEELAILRYR